LITIKSYRSLYYLPTCFRWKPSFLPSSQWVQLQVWDLEWRSRPDGWS